MSTISYTENYNLTKYDNVDNPLILKDLSVDHEKIDSALHGMNTRLEDVEDVIDTVSTQNIEDLMARLMAVEQKLDNNANSINSLTSSVNGLSTQTSNNANNIRNIYEQIDTINSDINELKQCCDNVRTTLVSHGDKIRANEVAIENINAQLVRVNEGIIGNAQDIATLATQLETVFESKQDKLIAGTGIRIDPDTNTISATSEGVISTYDAGNENIHIGG